MRKIYKTTGLVATLFCMLSGVNAQQTYTFTHCGATGSIGPTQTQVNNTYSSTNLAGAVGTTTSGIQTWTVPYSGNYRIQCIAASGGTSSAGATYGPGQGAFLQGDFALVGGEVLRILVGQQGEDGSSTAPGGGGGGSFVVRAPYTGTANALIVAGGGSGAGTYSSAPGLTTTSGGNAPSGGLGGTNGDGGDGGSRAAGGGGFLTDGDPCTVSTAYSNPGQAFVNGGLGGGDPNNTTCSATFVQITAGGFGGGASHGGNCIPNGGAGGGFSGGGGSFNNQSAGGGSLNQGSNQINTPGFNMGNGRVLITELCNITLSSSIGGTSAVISICSGQTLTLTTNAISNYSWTNGSTASSIVIAPTTSTVYGLTATSPQSCTAARQVSITVASGLPVLSVTQSTNSTCLGNTVSVNATGAVTYTWSNSIQNNVPFTPVSGTNNYTVTGQNGCGTSTALATVSVSALPVLAVANPSIVCENNVTTLTVTGASTYTWMPMFQTGTMALATVTAPTIYTVTGTTGSCSGMHTVQVNTKPNPTLTIVGTGSVPCMGTSVTLTVSGASTYTWVQTNLSGTLVTDTPTAPILYQVSGTNSVGCTTGTNYVVVPQSAPVLTSNFTSSTICNGGSVSLSAAGGNSYTWSTGSNANPLVLTPSGNTVISVTGGHNTNTCTTTQSYTVTVAVPVLPVSQNTAICFGGLTTLTAGVGQNYVWQPGGSQFPVLTDISPSVTTIYTVSADVTVLNISCPASSTVMVTVNPNPSVNVTPLNAVICRKDPIVLTASGASTYVWFTQATGSSITYSTNFVGLFSNTVVGTDANGCSTEASFSFSVASCNSIVERDASSSVLVYPNPSRGEITIRAERPVTLQMVNALGQHVKTIVIRSAEQVETVSGLAEGVYFITADGDKSVRESVIIQR
jgi:hypothetical protein